MCKVSLRFVVDANGVPLRQVRNEPFGEPIYVKSDVEDRIRRAQRAILNPSTPPVRYLEGEGDDATRTVSFSVNTICLQISGKDVADLSFCDLPGQQRFCFFAGRLVQRTFNLPGLIASGNDQETIENLVTSYIQKPSCIILLTVAGESEQWSPTLLIYAMLMDNSADWDNQRGYFLAQKHDPNGERTIGKIECLLLT